jgi:mono/diheme cytochrome c family protein
MNRTSIRVTLLAAAFLAGASTPSLAQSVEKGRAAFVKAGCWQCHGFVGQGGAAGPKLAPETKPLAYISAFIRNTNGPMPPYSEQVLSSGDLADIHAYLQSQPKAPDAKTIPLLN